MNGQIGGQFKEYVVDTPVNLLVDVGAKVSILNEASYHDNISKSPLQPTNEKLQSHDMSIIEVLGIISLPVC